LKKVEVGLLENHPKNISASGKDVLNRADQLVETTRKILVNKNPNNDIQDLLYHARLASEAAVKNRQNISG
jgi:hypothetical protein